MFNEASEVSIDSQEAIQAGYKAEEDAARLREMQDKQDHPADNKKEVDEMRKRANFRNRMESGPL